MEVKGGHVMKKDKPHQTPATLQLVSIAHAAQRLDVGTRTVRRYIRKGLLEAVVMGGRVYRIRESSLSDFIASLHPGKRESISTSPRQLDLGICHPSGGREDD
jgi:excisionase family DNA binding protein